MRACQAQARHAGIIYFAFNMWALWDGGRIAERLFGRLANAVLGKMKRWGKEEECEGMKMLLELMTKSA